MMRRLLTVAFGLAVLLLLPFSALAQDTGTVTGTVTDSESGDPLPGASVLIVELQQGGGAGSDGTYTIEDVTPGQYTIRASFIGYQEQQQDIQIDVEAGQTVTQNFSLTPDFTDLEEVVVIGYGERSRRDVTGSVSSVSSEDIQNIPTSSPEELLQGRTAGVQINKASGLPGSAIEIDVRGTSTISGGTQPLFVIDGVPARSRPSASNFGQAQNALQTIDPNSIQSIEVLKDASATAIYGSRASNGVVLITTKRGRAGGGTDITAGYYAGGVSATSEYEVLSGPEYVEIYQEAARNNLLDRGLTPETAPGLFADPLAAFGYPSLPAVENAPDFNLLDEAYRTGLTQQFNLSARGGTDDTRFYVNGTFHQNDGFITNNNFRRISGQINLDHDITDWARIGTTTNITRVLNNRVSADNNVSGVLTSSILRPPITPIRDEDGQFVFANGYNIAANPIADVNLNSEEDYEWYVRGNVFGEVDPFESLTLRGEGAINFQTTDEYSLLDRRTTDGSPSGVRSQNYFEERRYVLQGTADYTNTFADDHFLNLLGGASFESVERNQVFTAGSGVASRDLQTVATAATPTFTSSDVDRQERLISYFSRANYTYDDRYILELSGRVDGSSRFSEENRFGFFPAGALGWRISEESFMDDIDALDELKLRASYGITGNDQIGTFPALGLFAGTGDYAGVPGLVPSQLPNPDLRWEQSGQLDIGLDVGLFDNRIFLTSDFYRKQTDDLILSVPLPRSFAFNSFTQNVGGVRNTGFELSLETENITGEDFFWSTNVNAAYNQNEVTELVDNDGDGEGDPIPNGRQRIEEGRALGSYYLIQYEGVNPDNGQPIFTDVNGDDAITSDDRVFVGNQNPDWTGGFGSRAGYKGLELSFLFQFELGGQFYNNSRDFSFGLSTFNLPREALDRWTPDNTDTDVPQLQLFDRNSAARTSTRFLTDGDYLRLKDVTLSYALQPSLSQSIGVKNARIYVKGQNLLTFTDVDFADPESTTLFGGDVFYSPQQAQSITAGVDLTF